MFNMAICQAALFLVLCRTGLLFFNEEAAFQSGAIAL
jgi:hypothetical protein